VPPGYGIPSRRIAELPPGPTEIVLAALGDVRRETGETPMRITSLRVALLAEALLKRGVVFPPAERAGEEATPDG
jgi:hypothetical protein